MEKFTAEKINAMKNDIEKMEKYHQVEILRLFSCDRNVKINENKSGVFINLSLLPADILEKVDTFISYVKEQNTSLNNVEHEKEQYKNTFFTDENERQQQHKDNLLFVFNSGSSSSN